MLWRLWLAIGVAAAVVEAVVEEVEVDPSNTNGIELGEISFVQFLLCCAVFIMIVTLYAGGVLPIEIDLGEKFFETGEDEYYDDEPGEEYYYGEEGGDGEEEEIMNDYFYYDYATLTKRRRKRRMLSRPRRQVAATFLLDCPLQFVCEVDDWANKDHVGLLENLLAYWFRNPKKKWRGSDAAVFGGVGTCQEMYPCPFDVQEVVGIRIPGSNYTSSSPSSFSSSISSPSSSYFPNGLSPYSFF